MADFVAVIRRAVDGLSNNTPEMRVKVYEKARGAVMRQLDNMTPKPSEEMLRRQLDKLDAAITEVEAEYAEALPDVEDEVYVPEPEPVAEPVHVPAPAAEPVYHETQHHEPAHHEPVHEEPAYEEPAYEAPHRPDHEHHDHDHGHDDREHARAPEPDHRPEPAYEPAPEPAHAPAYQPAPWEEPVQITPPEPEPQRRSSAGFDGPAQPPFQPAPPVPITPHKQPMDEWLDSHLEPAAQSTPAAAPAEEKRPEPVSFPPIPPARQPVFDDTETLGAFDAFVRDNKATEPRGEEQAKDLLDWDVPGQAAGFDQAASFGQPAAAPGSTAKGKAGEDPAWFDDFAAAVPPASAKPAKKPARDAAANRANTSEEIAAVLAKAERKANMRGKKRRSVLPYVLTGVIIVLLGGGGYFAYAHRDNLPGALADLKQSINGMMGSSSSSTPASGTADPGKPASIPAGDAGAGGQKFTQKLMPDGTEVDSGASNAPASGNEGRSVAEQNGPANPGAPASGPAGAAATPPAQGAPFTVPENGQKAYLYEERLGQTTPTTSQGYVVWEAKRETGDTGKPEPEIQGKLTIPDKGLTALITFKRNTDSSLPASHLMEIVFSVPQNFEGGGIDSVQRVAMKVSEQDRGDPIVAVPAKITDDTFMIAFNDFAEVVARNVDLLRSREWIDIPVTYRNGRRALITLDKGTVGQPIFDSVIKEWAALGNNRSGG